jgi:hypothetical protein
VTANPEITMQRAALTLFGLVVCLSAASSTFAQSCQSQCDPALKKERHACSVHDKATVGSSNRREACLRDAEKRAEQCMARCTQSAPTAAGGAKKAPGSTPASAPAPAAK